MNTAKYSLMVDSADPDEPPLRHYATYDAALAAMRRLDDHYRKFAWIHELTDDGQWITVVKDGKVVPA